MAVWERTLIYLYSSTRGEVWDPLDLYISSGMSCKLIKRVIMVTTLNRVPNGRIPIEELLGGFYSLLCTVSAVMHWCG